MARCLSILHALVCWFAAFVSGALAIGGALLFSSFLLSVGKSNIISITCINGPDYVRHVSTISLYGTGRITADVSSCAGEYPGLYLHEIGALNIQASRRVAGSTDVPVIHAADWTWGIPFLSISGQSSTGDEPNQYLLNMPETYHGYLEKLLNGNAELIRVSRTRTGVDINGWAVCVVLVFPWAIKKSLQYAQRRRALLRSRSNRCVTCGYDLRASPGRCPECGAEPLRSSRSKGDGDDVN